MVETDLLLASAPQWAVPEAGSQQHLAINPANPNDTVGEVGEANPQDIEAALAAPGRSGGVDRPSGIGACSGVVPCKHILRGQCRRALRTALPRGWQVAADCVSEVRESDVLGSVSSEGRLGCGRVALPASRRLLTLQWLLAQSDIVSTATLARDPVVLGRHVQIGTHTSAASAPTCARQTTTPSSSLWKSSLTPPRRPGRKQHSGRTNSSAVTLFKSVGAALEDLAADVALSRHLALH